jgi:hypothetical protein
MAQGRFIVGVSDPSAVGHTVGTPLNDRENRTHTHLYSGTVVLAPRAIAALDGSNNSGARAASYMVSGSTATASANMGYVQLRACVKP